MQNVKTDVEGADIAPRAIAGLGEIGSRYGLILCDLWGCVHDGGRAFPEACDALSGFRRGGGRVVLVSNTPRPSHFLEPHLRRLGIPENAYDGLITAGDIMRDVLAERPGKIDFLGDESDWQTVADLAVETAPTPKADYAVCTRLFPSEDALIALDPHLEQLKAHNLDFICANPDIVVHDKGRTFYCPGALAERYETIGGHVIRTGKPAKRIYERALEIAGDPGDLSSVLAVGDGMGTDVTGAAGIGADSWFLSDGIHREIHETAGLTPLTDSYGVTPTYVSARLTP